MGKLVGHTRPLGNVSRPVASGNTKLEECSSRDRRCSGSGSRERGEMRRAVAADGGDWVCGDAGCANVNFARRPTCNRCGRRKPRQAASPAAGAEIGKSAADKSRGLFSADDWQCGKCANVNWARRQTCNVCNAPRFGEVEARTGYGGGYNERGVVEYRLRKDSDDDDYDEFGRVKKRKARDRERERDKDRDVKVRGERRRRRLLRSEDRDSSDPKRPLSIMENRVTSTNDVKYVFKGKTPEEDLEVTYSLQERVQVVAWAIAYRSCKTSAVEFQTRFDKPAPDFKTIFAWRQRLLDTGCLVDGHLPPSEPRNGTKRRRRPRYFRPVIRATTYSASDSTQEKSGDESNCNLDDKNNTNGSATRSSPSAKRSIRDIDITDDARSVSPNIITTRVELAQHRSPLKTVYFEESPKLVENITIPLFREPEPPKPLKKKIITDNIDNMLENIESESERYSSDPGSAVSVMRNKRNKKRACIVSISAADDSAEADFPIKEFVRRKSASEENGDDRTFSLAMRRMFGSISNRNETEEEVNVEYIPTKINPAMAERNHRLFKDVRDFWPEKNGSPIPTNEIDDAQVTKVVHIEDYMPDEDTLYRDDLSENKSNSEILIPPKAPNIGSIKNDSVVEDTSINLSSLLEFNLSSINTDDIALALKSIQTMSLPNNESKNENEPQKNCIISSESITKKGDNIPFLDDIFDPGSPPKEKDQEDKIADDENVGELILDDMDGCGRNKKSSVLGGFKSFALPKPILFKRLRNRQPVIENKDAADDDNNDKKTKNQTKKNSASNSHKSDNQSSKKLYDDEDEESEDEGDLSKYDLWSAEEESENKKDKEASSPSPKEATIDSEIKKGKEPSKSPVSPTKESKRQDRSRSTSSKRSSSSSCSTTSSSRKPPRNRYDDFILNSEHSRAGSRDSSSARSRSPLYDRSRERDRRRSRSRDKKDKSGRADRDRKSRDKRDSNKSRGRNRDRDRDRHHYSGNRSKPGSGYTRGRAR